VSVFSSIIFSGERLVESIRIAFEN